MREDDTEGRVEPTFLQAAALPMLMVLLCGGAVGMAESPVGQQHERRMFDQRFAGIDGPREVSPGAYEALRDLVAARPATARAVRIALSDGRLSTTEMRAIVGEIQIDPVATGLDVDAARADLAATAAAHA